MNRINNTQVASKVLNSHVALPHYKRESTQIGIVHFGIGAFHRSHQAVCTEAVMNAHGGDWGICGISLRSAGVRDQMESQDGLYSLAVNSNTGTQYQLIGAVKKVLVAPENPQAVIDQLCADSVKVVTLTITEKGYCLNPASGELATDHPGICHDLENLAKPQTALGFIAAACQQRMLQNKAGLTIISCDNWSNNGQRLAAALSGFCKALSSELAKWVADNVTCPSTMVDRIVPATTEEDRDRISQAIGLRDEACVMTEPFTQWVIENNFAGPVPAWDTLSQEFNIAYVSDVEPFEEMKLRLLNGSHSTLAYLSCLAGWETVARAISQAPMKVLIQSLMATEMAPTLSVPADFDLRAYQQELIDRFANTALNHKTRQIAMDGSQKIPQRLLSGLRDRLASGESCKLICLGVAAWIRYTRGINEDGSHYSVDDPMAEQFAAIHAAAGASVDSYFAGMLTLDSIFGTDLADNELFLTHVKNWLVQLEEKGTQQTLLNNFIQ